MFLPLMGAIIFIAGEIYCLDQLRKDRAIGHRVHAVGNTTYDQARLRRIKTGPFRALLGAFISGGGIALLVLSVKQH